MLKTEEIRKILKEYISQKYDNSEYKFAKAIGVDYTTVYRFLRYARGIGKKFIEGISNNCPDLHYIFLEQPLPDGNRDCQNDGKEVKTC